MNKHYLELQTLLCRAPEISMDQVFPSEKRLYGADKKVNHRLHPGYEEMVFSCEEHLLYPYLAAGMSKMNAKLSSYAQNQLPDGKYWEPEPDVAKNVEVIEAQ